MLSLCRKFRKTKSYHKNIILLLDSPITILSSTNGLLFYPLNEKETNNNNYILHFNELLNDFFFKTIIRENTGEKYAMFHIVTIRNII